jgi:glycolate oxidase
MLLAQSDGGGELGTAEAEMMAGICKRAGASLAEVTADALETQVFMSARKLALPALQRLGTALLDDVAVPPSRIVDLISAIHAVAAHREVTIGTFGHAGDGNMHPTIVFDPTDQASSARAAMAFDDIVRAALDLGGTVTGEHGVGVLKREYLPSELGPISFRLQASVKRLLDPQGILNPGKVF